MRALKNHKHLELEQVEAETSGQTRPSTLPFRVLKEDLGRVFSGLWAKGPKSRMDRVLSAKTKETTWDCRYHLLGEHMKEQNTKAVLLILLDWFIGSKHHLWFEKRSKRQGCSWLKALEPIEIELLTISLVRASICGTGDQGMEVEV